MQKSDLTLFFSMPLDAVDYANIAASHVNRVMLPLALADIATLDKLHGMGVRVVLRVGEGDYYDDLAPGRIRNQVSACANHANVSAVIVGCEPDNGAQWEYGAPTWSQDRAYSHRTRFDAVRLSLQAAGFWVVSPGWTMRSISEDEPSQPGRATWAEIVRPAYDEAGGNGVHLYQYGWDGPVDEIRLKFALKEAGEMWHKPLWIDEVGIAGNATAAEKMRAYIDIAHLLYTKPIGRRVSMLCPFVSNGDPGNPPAWDSRFLIRDTALYAELGKWVLTA